MAHAIEKTPLNWYQDNARKSIDLMRSYVQSVEEQIGKLVEEFKASFELQVNDIEDALEEGYFDPDMVPTHGGLDADLHDLESVFGERLPNLQRRSALITLYSFLDYELSKLCDLFVRHQKLKVSFNDMRGAGVDRAILFLEKVVGLQVDKKTALWQEVTQIRDLRNCIVHADAKLRDWSGKPKDIAKYVETSAHLSGEDEIILSGDYLFHVLKIFDRQFQELNKLIAALPPLP